MVAESSNETAMFKTAITITRALEALDEASQTLPTDNAGNVLVPQELFDATKEMLEGICGVILERVMCEATGFTEGM
jgi:hypothetical protein